MTAPALVRRYELRGRRLAVRVHPLSGATVLDGDAHGVAALAAHGRAAGRARSGTRATSAQPSCATRSSAAARSCSPTRTGGGW